MAGVGRSIKPTLLSPKLMRPGHPRRTLSNSSEISSAASSPRSEDPFVFSVGHTPTQEEPPGPISTNVTPTAASAVSKDRQSLCHDMESLQSRNTGHPSRHDWPDYSTSHGSRPIAIELPPRRRPNTASVYTPPEPLSARGDVIGGYFPFHENPTCRVYRPHPFHPDTTRARHHSITQAANYGSWQPTQREVGATNNMFESFHSANAAALGVLHPTDSTGTIPMTSYVPSGVHENALPMGKYYPSNYESRRRTQQTQRSSSPAPSKPATSIIGTLKPESAASKFRRSSSQGRSESDATRRLQQYQRDMITQATMAASHVLGSVDRVPDTTVAATAALHGAPVQTLQLGSAMIDRSKPTAPKLVPMGSPGPVTPMQLDATDGYLFTGKTTARADAVRDGDEDARATQADEKRPREGESSPPAINVGPI